MLPNYIKGDEKSQSLNSEDLNTLINDWEDYDILNNNIRDGWLNEQEVNIINRYKNISNKFPIKNNFILYRGTETLPNLDVGSDGYYYIEHGIPFKSFNIEVAKNYGQFLFVFEYNQSNVLRFNEFGSIDDEDVGFTRMDQFFRLTKIDNNIYYFIHVGERLFDYSTLYSKHKQDLIIHALRLIKQISRPGYKIKFNNNIISIFFGSSNRFNQTKLNQFLKTILKTNNKLEFSILDQNSNIIGTYEFE